MNDLRPFRPNELLSTQTYPEKSAKPSSTRWLPRSSCKATWIVCTSKGQHRGTRPEIAKLSQQHRFAFTVPGFLGHRNDGVPVAGGKGRWSADRYRHSARQLDFQSNRDPF